jgi:hypothetical protein
VDVRKRVRERKRERAAYLEARRAKGIAGRVVEHEAPHDRL